MVTRTEIGQCADEFAGCRIGDYDGDGKTDIAIYRDGIWWIRQSTGGIVVQQFGLASDTPVQAVSAN